MDLELKEEAIIRKCLRRLDFNFWLLSISFILFTFIIALNPGLIKSNNFLSIQLTTAIPLLCSSIFAIGKIDKGRSVLLWEVYAFLTFIVAYSFMINTVGILLTKLVSINMGIFFWSSNIFLALSYSVLEIYTERQNVLSRLSKDLIFIGILTVLGILPALGFYH